MAISKIPSAGFQDNVKFRNIIINGDMSIAQRGTSATGINTTSDYSTVDRFEMNVNGMGVFSQEQSTDVPSGQGFANSMKLDCTTADASPSANDYLAFRQKIEGQNLQYLKKGTSNAESLTSSFWVKSNKTGTYTCELDDIDNSRTISKSYTIDTADTWEKKIITFDGDTTGVFDNDNANSLRLNFWLGAGSNFTSGTLQTSWGSTVNTDRAVGNVNLADSTSNEWLITGVQLESGSASDFEFLPHDINLQRCFRYCNATLNYGDGNIAPNRHYTGAHGSHGYIQIDITPMRVTPSLTYGVHGGSLSLNYSCPTKVVLTALNDTSVMAYDLIAEAEL